MCNSNVITASRKLVIPASGLNLLLRETTQTVGETGSRSTTFFIRFSPTAACAIHKGWIFHVFLWKNETPAMQVGVGWFICSTRLAPEIPHLKKKGEKSSPSYSQFCLKPEHCLKKKKKAPTPQSEIIRLRPWTSAFHRMWVKETKGELLWFSSEVLLLRVISSSRHVTADPSKWDKLHRAHIYPSIIYHFTHKRKPASLLQNTHRILFQNRHFIIWSSRRRKKKKKTT